uniref:Candidate secreted effector n=1 Tax=Meloidogyne incognita TaxID=6306 RepID=A0A914L0G9_MELIC
MLNRIFSEISGFVPNQVSNVSFSKVARSQKSHVRKCLARKSRTSVNVFFSNVASTQMSYVLKSRTSANVARSQMSHH